MLSFERLLPDFESLSKTNTLYAIPIRATLSIARTPDTTAATSVGSAMYLFVEAFPDDRERSGYEVFRGVRTREVL